MNLGRILLIVGVLIILAALVFVAYYFLKPSPPPPAPVVVEERTPQPQIPNMVEIVVAAQNIPRGMRITEDAVVLRFWPTDALPEGYIHDLKSVYGKITRVEIVRGMPVTERMVTATPGDLGGVGSDVALQIPEGRVAYAIPVSRYSSIAWALRPGDRVDVLLSLLFVDLDEEFQSLPPNQARCLSPAEGEGCESGAWGRAEALPNGWIVNMLPSEGQRPRLVTQLTVQDAIVLQVGDWPSEVAATPEPTPVPSGEEAPSPTPTPSPERVDVLTLAVTRQDAIALEYAWVSGARINLVLRRAGDTQFVTTEPGTLQYLMERFQIQLPPKLPHGVTPPLSGLERIPQSQNAGQYGEPSKFQYDGRDSPE